MHRVALLIAIGACVQSQETICDDGSVCPSALRCDLVHHTCVTAEQLTACNGLADGDDCPLVTGTGVCNANVCLEQVCGDGLVTGAEECDGDTAALCTSLGYYDPVPLTCSARCTFDVAQCTGTCGDGVINGPAGTEVCDGAPPTSTCLELGFDRGPLSCNAFCAPQLASCRRMGFAPRTTISDETITGIYRASPTHTFYTTYSSVIEDGPNGVRIRDTSAMFGVYGFGPTDVYAVGTGGTIDHFDGTTWTTVREGAILDQYNAIWGSSPTDLYVVGDDDEIRRGSGTTWTIFDTAGSGTWYAITGWGTTLVVAGDTGRIRRFVNGTPQNETTTDCFPSPGTADAFYGVWGTSPSDIFAVGTGGTICHYDGTGWSKQLSGTLDDLRAVWGRASNDVFAVGNSGVVLHHDGVGWRRLDIDSVASFHAIGASGADVQIAGLLGEVYDYNGSGLSTVSAPSVLDKHAAAPSPGNEYIVRNDRVYRWRDGAWTSVLQTSPYIGALWVSASGVAHAYANTDLYRSDGLTWAPPVITNYAPAGLVGADESDLYGFRTAVPSTVGRYNGSTWTTIATTPTQLVDIAWAGGTAFVVGNDSNLPRVLVCTGSTCVESALPGTRRVNGVYAASPTDAFTVGAGGEIFHFDGTTWTAMSSGIASGLLDIAGTSGSDVFAVGGAGVVLHYDGATWSRIRIPLPQTFTTVAVREDLVVIGGATATQYSIVRDNTW